jgi:hypothetical protein
MMSHFAIDNHRVYTPFSVVDGYVLKTPNRPGPRLEFAIREPGQVGRLPNGQRVHHAMLHGFVGSDLVINTEIWIIQNTADASGHLSMSEPTGIAHTGSAEQSSSVLGHTPPSQKTLTSTHALGAPTEPHIEIPIKDLENIHQRVFDHVNSALENVKDPPPDVTARLTATGRAAAEQTYRLKRDTGLSAPDARKQAGNAAKRAIKDLAIAEAEALAIERARSAIADGTVFDMSKMPRDAKIQHEEFRAGRSGGVAQKMATTLPGKDLPTMERLLDVELAHSGGTKTAQLIKDPTNPTATQVQQVYAFADGTLVRVKPKGDTYNPGRPMFSVEVKQVPPSNVLPGQGGVGFKVNDRGQPVPKGSVEIANPYERGRYQHQRDVFEQTVLAESHQHVVSK